MTDEYAREAQTTVHLLLSSGRPLNSISVDMLVEPLSGLTTPAIDHFWTILEDQVHAEQAWAWALNIARYLPSKLPKAQSMAFLSLHASSAGKTSNCDVAPLWQAVRRAADASKNDDGLSKWYALRARFMRATVHVDTDLPFAEASKLITSLTTIQPCGHSMSGHTDTISVVGLTNVSGAPTAVTGSYDGTVRMWDISSRRPASDPLSGHSGGVRALAIVELRELPIAIVGTDSGKVYSWNLSNKIHVVDPFVAHRGSVFSLVAFTSTEGVVLITSGRDRKVRRWRLFSDEINSQTLRGQFTDPGPLSYLTFDGQSIVIGGCLKGDNGLVEAWDANTTEHYGEAIAAGYGPVWSVAATVINQRPVVASVGYDAIVRVSDLLSGALISKSRPFRMPGMIAVTFASVDGNTVVIAGGGDGKIRAFDALSGNRIGEAVQAHVDPISVSGHQWHRAMGMAVTRQAGSLFMLTTGSDKTVRVWDLKERHHRQARILVGAVLAVVENILDRWERSGEKPSLNFRDLTRLVIMSRKVGNGAAIAYAEMLRTRFVCLQGDGRVTVILADQVFAVLSAADRLPDPHLTLSWEQPGRVVDRILLELLRMGRQIKWPQHLSANTDGPLPDADADRLAAVALSRELDERIVPKTRLVALDALSMNDGLHESRCVAHSAVPPLRVVVARGWLALGDGHRADICLGRVEPGLDHDRAYYAIAEARAGLVRHLRLHERLNALTQAATWNERFSHAELETRALLGPANSEEPVVSSLTELHHRWRRFHLVGTDVRPRDSAIHAFRSASSLGTDNEQWAISAAEMLSINASFVEVSFALDVVEAQRVLQQEIPALAVALSAFSANEWWNRHLMQRAEAAILALRCSVLKPDSIPANLMDNIGRRRFAELALDECEMLQLRLPVEAASLAEVATEVFDQVDDALGAFRAAVLGSLQTSNPTTREQLRRLQRLYTDAFSSMSDLPEWSELEQAVNADNESPFRHEYWGAWLTRLAVVLAKNKGTVGAKKMVEQLVRSDEAPFELRAFSRTTVWSSVKKNVDDGIYELPTWRSDAWSWAIFIGGFAILIRNLSTVWLTIGLLAVSGLFVVFGLVVIANYLLFYYWPIRSVTMTIRGQETAPNRVSRFASIDVVIHRWSPRSPSLSEHSIRVDLAELTNPLRWDSFDSHLKVVLGSGGLRRRPIPICINADKWTAPLPWEVLLTEATNPAIKPWRASPYMGTVQKVGRDASSMLLVSRGWARDISTAISELAPEFPMTGAVEDAASVDVLIVMPTDVRFHRSAVARIQDLATAEPDIDPVLFERTPIELQPRYRKLIVLLQEPGSLLKGATHRQMAMYLRGFGASLLESGANAVLFVPRLPVNIVIGVLKKLSAALRTTDDPAEVMRAAQLVAHRELQQEGMTNENAASYAFEFTIFLRRSISGSGSALSRDAYESNLSILTPHSRDDMLHTI
jgi:WD40 repeat protein